MIVIVFPEIVASNETFAPLASVSFKVNNVSMLLLSQFAPALRRIFSLNNNCILLSINTVVSLLAIETTYVGGVVSFTPANLMSDVPSVADVLVDVWVLFEENLSKAVLNVPEATM